VILYEVNLIIDADAADDYAAWLADHIGDILRIDGFVSAEWWEVETGEPGAHYCVQYRVKSRDHLEAYFRDHAPALREDGLRRFGGRFAASRRILRRQRAFG
jgi:heme-degrading monooxygenase HmoA